MFPVHALISLIRTQSSKITLKVIVLYRITSKLGLVVVTVMSLCVYVQVYVCSSRPCHYDSVCVCVCVGRI